MVKYVTNRMIRRSAVFELMRGGYDIVHARDIRVVGDREIAMFVKSIVAVVITSYEGWHSCY